MKPEELRQKLVLVVDDDPLMLMLLETVLKGVVQTATARGGAQALDRVRAQPQPDLILLDVSMPGMSGHEVCRQLKADPATRDIPVIFTTAAGDDEDEAVGFSLGAADYITKPFRLPVVTARVRAHLETQHLNQQIRVHNRLLDEKVRERTRELEQEMRNRRQAEDRFVYQVYHDLLSGLPNRVFFQQRMGEFVGTKGMERFAVVLMSLAGFHEINNTLGYENGSKFLIQVTERLSAVAAAMPGARLIEEVDGRQNRLAVLAGVNFGMLLDAADVSVEELMQRTQAVLDAIDEPFDFQGMALNVGVNIGIAVAPDHGGETDALLRHAHIAMEEAASSDKRVAVYSESINRYSARRLTLMGELRAAIQQDALQLAYQPQLHLGSNRIVSAEALLRWQHPRLGFVRPDEFIPLAEQTGVIKSLTAWVLRSAIRQCRAFVDQGLSLGISVNLSARNLREPELMGYIRELLAEYRVPPEMLMLEVTETVMMQNPEGALKILGQLDNEGLRSSIDDFGTGYSSLGYLKRLPVSEIKIDRSFVMDMIKDKDDRVIVQTIVDMGHNLGLRVVAEGVEDQEILDALREMGCDLAQGYYMSKPVFADALVEWLPKAPYGVATLELAAG